MATQKYRLQLWLGWALLTASTGALSTLRTASSLPTAIGLTVMLGIGSGIIANGSYYPVLAPLPASQNAHALAFFGLGRVFAGVSTCRYIRCVLS